MRSNVAVKKGEKIHMNYRPEEVVKAAGGKLLYKGSLSITGISTDTRSMQEGDAFLALTGPNFNGHAFVGEAVSKGAAALILSNEVIAGDPDPQFDADGNVSVIGVEDTLVAYGKIAAAHRKEHSATKVVAITGSAGKTTTKELTAAVLGVKYSVLKNDGTHNNLVGVPETLLKIEDEDIAIVEIGTNQPGEIAALAKIASPDVALVTNVGAAHLEGLGSVKGVAKEKSGLPKSLGPEQIFVVNLSDHNVVEMAGKTKAKLIGFASKEAESIDTDETIRLMEVREGNNVLNLALTSTKGEIGVKLPALGYHNAVNALAAAAIGRAFNMTLREIKQGLESAQLPSGRGDIIKTVSGTTIINDSYNSNPLSAVASLKVLRSMRRDGKIIALLGDMLELGNASATEHEKLGEEAARLDIDELICIGQYAKNLASGFRNKCGKEAWVVKNNQDAAKQAASLAGPRDSILVKGSRLLALDKVIDDLKGRLARAS